MSAMECAGAVRPVISPVRLDRPALAIHVSRSRPIGQRSMGAGLVAPLRRRVKESIDPGELLAAATEGGIGVKDLPGLVAVEYAVAGQVLQFGRPFRRALEIVDGGAGSDLL